MNGTQSRKNSGICPAPWKQLKEPGRPEGSKRGGGRRGPQVDNIISGSIFASPPTPVAGGGGARKQGSKPNKKQQVAVCTQFLYTEEEAKTERDRGR